MENAEVEATLNEFHTEKKENTTTTTTTTAFIRFRAIHMARIEEDGPEFTVRTVEQST